MQFQLSNGKTYGIYNNERGKLLKVGDPIRTATNETVWLKAVMPTEKVKAPGDVRLTVETFSQKLYDLPVVSTNCKLVEL
jgi:hypothetical protein